MTPPGSAEVMRPLQPSSSTRSGSFLAFTARKVIKPMSRLSIPPLRGPGKHGYSQDSGQRYCRIPQICPISGTKHITRAHDTSTYQGTQCGRIPQVVLGLFTLLTQARSQTLAVQHSTGHNSGALVLQFRRHRNIHRSTDARSPSTSVPLRGEFMHDIPATSHLRCALHQ